MEGEGIIRQKDGGKFRGQFHEGEKHGKCIMESPDGIRFEGSYVNDVRDGDFVEKDRNGNVIRRGHYTRGIIDK